MDIFTKTLYKNGYFVLKETLAFLEKGEVPECEVTCTLYDTLGVCSKTAISILT